MQLLNKSSLPRLARLASTLAVLLALTALVPSAEAQDNIFTIEVAAVGTAIGVPDRASLEFGIEVVSTDLESAINQVTQKADAISEALIDLDIAPQDIQASSVQVTSDDLNDPNTGIITGELVFHVSTAMQVVIRDISSIQTVITTAVANGANTLGGLTMGIEDLDSLEQEARQAAIANAYQRAQALAAGFNLVLSAPIIVTETIDNNGLPVPLSGSDVRRPILDSDDISLAESPLVITVQLNVVFRTQTQAQARATPIPQGNED